MEQERTDIFYVIIHDLNSMSLLGPDCTAIVSLFLRFAESGQTDQAFISGESSSAFPWNWEDKVKPQGLCSTQKPRTFIFLHQLCNLPLSFQWLCVCIFSLRFFSIWISSVWSSACWISRLFLLFCFCHRCLYVRLWRCTNKKTHLRHGMTKDTCISISVLAKKPGSVVLPPLFKKNNKKGFFFLLCCLACFPPSTVHSCFSPHQSFAAGGVPSAFDIFRIRKACGNSLFIVPLWLIIQTAALGSERPVICRHCPVRSWTDTLCRIQNLEFIIPMLLYSSLEVTVGAESRIRLPIVGPAISQKCRVQK